MKIDFFTPSMIMLLNITYYLTFYKDIIDILYFKKN